MRTSPAGLVLVAVLLHVLIYAPSLPGAFTFDDRKIVVTDPEVSGRAPLRGVFSRPYFGPGFVGLYRPVTLLSLGLDVRLFGLSPAALRAENLLWAGAGVGLFAWLALLLGAPPVAAWSLVLLASAHPVRSEAIITVVGRSELLAFAFLTAALLVARAGLHEMRRGRRALLAGASGLLLVLALFSKENAFAAPALLLGVLVVDRVPSGETQKGASSRLLPLVISWVAAFALVLAARRAGMGGWLAGERPVIGPYDNVLVRLAPDERRLAAVALVNIARDRLLWPKTLAADYGPVSFRREEILGGWAVAGGAATLLAGAGLCLALLKRRAVAWFGLGWAAVTYLPFANFFFVTGTAFGERLLYMPAAGLVLALTGGIFPGRAPVRAISRGLAISLLAGFSILGIMRIEKRIPEWRDDRTLFAATVRDVPLNGRAWYNLAVMALSDGDLPAVSNDVAGALRADPLLRQQVDGLRRHAEAIDRPDEAEAIRQGVVAATAPARHP